MWCTSTLRCHSLISLHYWDGRMRDCTLWKMNTSELLLLSTWLRVPCPSRIIPPARGWTLSARRTMRVLPCVLASSPVASTSTPRQSEILHQCVKRIASHAHLPLEISGLIDFPLLHSILVLLSSSPPTCSDDTHNNKFLPPLSLVVDTILPLKSLELLFCFLS